MGSVFYSCSVKICASGFNRLLEGIFCILLVVEALSWKKIFRMLEVVISCWEVRWIWQMRLKFRGPICLTFEVFGCAICDQALSWRRIGPILLTDAGFRCCSFPCISLNCWACFSYIMVSWDSGSCTGSDWQQTTKQWPWLFFGVSLALGSALELLSPVTELVVISCRLKATFRHMS